MTKYTILCLSLIAGMSSFAMSKNNDRSATTTSTYTPPTPQEELENPTHSEFPDSETTRQQGLYPRDSQSQTSRNEEIPMDDVNESQQNRNPATLPDGNTRSQEDTERMSQ